MNAEGITAYRYDGRGRMIQADSAVKGERKTIQYAYDALGRRTVRQEAGISGQRTVYDAFSFDEARSLALSADGSIVPESGKKTGGSVTGGKYRYEGPTTDGSNVKGMKYQATRNSIYVNSIPAAYKSSDGVFYSGADRLGSTETITDEEGQLFEDYEYDAFGGLISGNPEKGSGKLYAGKSYDPVTKTYDYGFRDYLPSMARFTTVDPIRDGANWYAYCNADPVNYVDLWGLVAADKYTKANPLSQTNFDKEYGFPEKGPTVSCQTCSLINVYATKEGIADKELDNAVASWKKDGAIDKNGTPSDINKMSKTLATEMGLDYYYSFVYPQPEKKTLTQSSQDFSKSKYDAGIQTRTKEKGDEVFTHYTAVIKEDGKESVVDSFDPNRPGADKYNVSNVIPLQKLPLK